MAFRTFLYLDSEKVAEYSSIIDAPTKRAASKRLLAGGVNFGVAKMSAEIESDLTELPETSPAVLYNAFESALQQRINDDYFDCTNGKVDMLTLPQMSIVRCEGQIEIPDSFDTLSMVSEFLPFLRSAGLVTLDSGQVTTEFALSFFEQTNADIPILIRGNDILIASKLKTSLLVGADYRMLEDCEDEDFFVLFKVHSIAKKGSTAVFDPAKDFLKLNRALRRSMKSGLIGQKVCMGLVPIHSVWF